MKNVLLVMVLCVGIGCSEEQAKQLPAPKEEPVVLLECTTFLQGDVHEDGLQYSGGVLQWSQKGLPEKAQQLVDTEVGLIIQHSPGKLELLDVQPWEAIRKKFDRITLTSNCATDMDGGTILFFVLERDENKYYVTTAHSLIHIPLEINDKEILIQIHLGHVIRAKKQP